MNNTDKKKVFSLLDLWSRLRMLQLQLVLTTYKLITRSAGISKSDRFSGNS